MGLLRMAWENDVALRYEKLGLVATGIVFGMKEKIRWLKARPMPLEKADMVTMDTTSTYVLWYFLP